MLDVPPPHTTHMAVSARPDAPPMMTAPIALIVPASGCRARRPVAHLVRRVAGGGEPVVSDQILIGKIIIIGEWQLAAPNTSRQAGALLDDQCVGADVLRCC